MRKDSRDLPLAIELHDGVYQRTYYDSDGKQQPTKEYLYWHKINTRCKSHYHKSRPSYIGYNVAGDFKDYNKFVQWCRKTPEFFNKGYVLDKDLLCKTKGKFEYSEDTCVFIPLEINSFLTLNKSNVKCYTGVSFQVSCGRYIVSCSQLNGKNKTLARVACPVKGYEIYKAEKVRLAKVLADKYKDQVDGRVIEILSNFENYIDLFTVNPTNKE